MNDRPCLGRVTIGTLAAMELRTDSFSANPQMRTRWYVVADATDVADAPLGVTLLGEHFVLWRGADGHVSAAPDRCPHREAPLSQGMVAGGCLVCPYHAWAFDGSGTCVEVPSSGSGAAIPSAAALRLVAVARALRPRLAVPGDTER